MKRKWRKMRNLFVNWCSLVSSGQNSVVKASLQIRGNLLWMEVKSVGLRKVCLPMALYAWMNTFNSDMWRKLGSCSTSKGPHPVMIMIMITIIMMTHCYFRNLKNTVQAAKQKRYPVYRDGAIAESTVQNGEFFLEKIENVSSLLPWIMLTKPERWWKMIQVTRDIAEIIHIYHISVVRHLKLV